MKKKHFYAAVILLTFLAAGIKPVLAIDIPDDESVGTWDSMNRIYTLNSNVTEGLVIVASSFTLDGNGKTVKWASGSGPRAYGVWMSGKIGVIIKNLNIQNFHTGIYLLGGISNKLIGNTASGNLGCGIIVSGTNNILTSNTASGNKYGIRLNNSRGDTLTDNEANGNINYGIELSCSYDYTLTENTVSNNFAGIFLYACSTINDDFNTITNNTVSNNVGGIYLYNSSNNQIYKNNLIIGKKTAWLAHMYANCTGNVFNLDPPIGGNYWSDWSGSGEYVFNGGQDDYPWTVQDGWSAPVNQPPVADAGPDQTVEQESYEGTEVTLDGSGSTDPDSTPGTNDDIVIFDWYEGDTFLGSGETINYTFPLGSHTVTLKVTDSFGETDEDEVIITVVDTTSPEVACSVNPEVLWQPKNHRMVPVVVFIEAIDICTETDDLTLVVTAESSEPDDYKGDGAFTGDVDGADGFTGPVDVSYAFSPDIGGFVGVIDLRAERDGRGVDRIYTITAIVKDASGNETTAICDVTVPYDQGEGKKGKEKPHDQGKGKKDKGKK